MAGLLFFSRCQITFVTKNEYIEEGKIIKKIRNIPFCRSVPHSSDEGPAFKNTLAVKREGS